MQISKIKISNILSFPYLQNFDEQQDIIFDTESNGNVNILIGPNGAGKSNFLLIINEVFKAGLMKDYIYQPQIIRENNKANFKNVITRQEILLDKLSKHFNQHNKESKILIGIKLNNNDIENIGYISKNKKHFQSIVKKYSNINFDLPDVDTQEISKNRYIDIVFDIDIANKKVSINQSKLSQKENTIIEYLKNSELIQICGMIKQEFNYPKKNINFHELKNTFASIGLHRNFYNLPTKIDPQGRNEYIAKKNTIQYPPFIGYYLCLNKIRNIINQGIINSKRDLKNISIEEIDEILKKSDFYINLNLTIQKYFNKNLLIGKENNEIYFYIIDNLGQILKFQDLSDGEQSLLTIIFALYGFDIKDGIMLIDEPEIHSHPQIQRRLIKLLQKVSINSGTQFIISTYSPLFINELNISNVYKFSKIDGETKIINPGNISTDEGSLIQMLKFDNASKIFFSKKIIMVEGETDAYFFEFYLNYLHTFKERKSIITDYEIININGKGSFKRRKKFLSKFGIKSYFIGDRDNTVEFDILKQIDLNYYYQQSKKYNNIIKKNKGNINRHYTKLVDTIRDLHPQKHDYIIKKIERMYDEDIFILKKGDIETYLGIKSKGLEQTINFCHRHFHGWLNNRSTLDHRHEINYIVSRIFP